MTEIFKFFFGAVAIIIIVYVFVILFRTVVIGSFTATKDVVTNKEVQNTVATSSEQLASWLSQFTLQSFFSSWRPFQYEPGQVVVANRTGSHGQFYNGSNFSSGWDKQKLYWQNLDDAPNSHPTDYVDLGTSGSYRNNNSESVNQETLPKVIFPKISEGQEVKNGEVIIGFADYRIFTGNYFLAYVLDETGEILGKVKVFQNGDARRDGLVPFRVVLSFIEPQSVRGMILFRSENPNLPFKTLAPIYFK